MSDDSDTWTWVDEDPIEKLLRPTLAAATPARFGAAPLIDEGRAQFERGRFEEAASSYSAALEAEPDHPSAHFDLAVCLEKLGQFKAAANAFRRAAAVWSRAAPAPVPVDRRTK